MFKALAKTWVTRISGPSLSWMKGTECEVSHQAARPGSWVMLHPAYPSQSVEANPSATRSPAPHNCIWEPTAGFTAERRFEKAGPRQASLAISRTLAEMGFKIWNFTRLYQPKTGNRKTKHQSLINTDWGGVSFYSEPLTINEIITVRLYSHLKLFSFCPFQLNRRLQSTNLRPSLITQVTLLNESSCGKESGEKCHLYPKKKGQRAASPSGNCKHDRRH